MMEPALASIIVALKRHQVSVHQVVLADGGVKDVPLRLRSAMYGVVFWSRDYFEVTRIVALHPFTNSTPMRLVR